MAGSTAVLRIARRSLLRDRWRALLIVVLIGLPVLGITTAALVLETALPTTSERATQRMGAAHLRVTPLGSVGRAELTGLVPRGTAIEPIWQGSDQVVLSGTRPNIGAWFLDPDGLAGGMLTMLEGKVPTAPDEVAVSPALAALSETGIGGTLQLADLGTVRVVGVMEDRRNLTRLVVLGQATLAEAPDLRPEWLVSLPPDVVESAVADHIAARIDPAFEEFGQPMFDVLTRAQAGQASDSFVSLIVLLGSLALVESALVASAAFAVGIRRRQRELGLMGAAGASPRQLAGSVLAEGLVVGLVAVGVGIGLGITVAAILSPRLDEMTGQRTGSLELDPVVLALACLVGLLATIVAAAVPAWGAARLPTLVALSGRRPPATPARRLLALGVTLIAIALGCTLLVPLAPGGIADMVPLLLLVVGAVTGVLGFGACSPWLLERLEGVARRSPLAPRVALRDTARARTRNGPIVTAVLASVAATIALASILASQQAQSMTFWRPEVASDSMMIHGDLPEDAGARIATELGAVGYGPDRGAESPDGAWYYEIVMPALDPDPADDLLESSLGFRVGDERLLLAHHGEAALEAFRGGSTVVFVAPGTDPGTGTAAAVVRWDYDDLGEASRSIVGEVPVTRIPARGATMGAIMPRAAAATLGLELGTAQTQYLVRLDHDVTPGDMERAASIAVAVDPIAHVSGPLPPQDPMMGFRVLMLAAALIAALTVTGIAVALGEIEARPDQRTLLALGAQRGLRRRITASRGLVIAGLAGLLAVPAGLLPVWGVLVPLGWPIVVPVPEIVCALLVLPLAAVVGGLLLGRPIPEWSARRDTA